MKIVFFGTSDFAIPSLKKILKSKHELCAVMTQPDRRKGRKLVLTPPPVKAELGDSPIPIHQPSDASDPNSVNILKKYAADLFVVVEFGQILKREVLRIPKKFCVNLHASILPKYRGASPINWAVMNGDLRTGVTTIKMAEKMDSGDMILQEEIDIRSTDTSETLREKLSEMGAEALLKTIELIGSEKAVFKKQDEKDITYAPKLKKEDGLIDWSRSAKEINDKVRGLIPWPSAYTHREKKLIKIWKTEYSIKPLPNDDTGRVLRLEGGIVVGTGKGELTIKILQLEGGKKLDADAFLRGHKLSVGDRFE
jgi:methionyl-tRNA formyltransferase